MQKFKIQKDINELIQTLDALMTEDLTTKIQNLSENLLNTIKSGNKVITFGNGGSAAESNHFAAELVSKCTVDHRPWPAQSLSESTSIATAIGNDYGFDKIFSRQLEAVGNAGDLVVAFSTSGSSPNVLSGLKTASSLGCNVFLLTGEKYVHNPQDTWKHITVPSKRTTRIQEVHLLIIHSISEYCEEKNELK